MKKLNNILQGVAAVIAQHVFYLMVFFMLCVSFAALLMPETKK